MKLFALFLLLFAQASSTSSKILPGYPQSHDNSSILICQTLKATINSEQGTHDILLAKIDDNIKDSVADDISRCLGSENPMIIMDLSVPVVTKYLNKAKLMIIEGSSIDMVCKMFNSCDLSEF
ncbi:hypothetical protein ACKWTF_015082 [Chironomus riparius]